MEHQFLIATIWMFLAVIATIIASAIIPTFIAGLAFLPGHLIPLQEKFRKVAQPEEGFPEEG